MAQVSGFRFQVSSWYNLKPVTCNVKLSRLDRFPPPFAGPNANAVVHWQDEDFTVADLAFIAGAAPFDNRPDRRLDEIVVDGDLKLDLTEEIHFVLMAAIQLRLPFLPAETLAIEDRQAKDLNLSQRLLHRFQSAGLNDGND